MLFCITSVYIHSMQKQTILTLNDSYLHTENTAEENTRTNFSTLVTEWQRNLPASMQQSEYEAAFVELFLQGVKTNVFSNKDIEEFKKAISHKGILEEALHKANYPEGLAQLIGSGEEKARELLITDLTQKLNNLKEKTPDNIRNAVRQIFGQEAKQSSSTNIMYNACWFGLGLLARHYFYSWWYG
ncbi:MAG: hypothetical protein AB7R69_01285 [Candidatus Babeliales bacterium]